jgi:mannitol/fructose-specific phosphotransferase system IIA component (Ntr-type)
MKPPSPIIPLTPDDNHAGSCERIVIGPDSHGRSRQLLIQYRADSHLCLVHNAAFEIDFEAADRWEAISSIIQAMYYNSELNQDTLRSIQARLQLRERTMSTGIGGGLAVPHASADVYELQTGWFRSRLGINWDALDGQLVFHVFCVVVPRKEFTKYSMVLPRVSKLLFRQEFRYTLEQAASLEEYRTSVVDGLRDCELR